MAFHTFTTDVALAVIEAGPTDDGNWDGGYFKIAIPDGADKPEPGEGFELINDDGVWIGEVAEVDTVTQTALLKLY